MTDPNVEKAREIIRDIRYITIATVSTDGLPWNTPVFAAFDEDYNFFWRSGKNSQHSQNIKENENVFLTIYDSTSEWGTGKGIFIKAKAYELNDERDVTYGLSLLDKRAGKTMGFADSFMNGNPRRVYKAVPEKVWVNQDSYVNGKFVDIREEVDLLGQ